VRVCSRGSENRCSFGAPPPSRNSPLFLGKMFPGGDTVSSRGRGPRVDPPRTSGHTRPHRPWRGRTAWGEIVVNARASLFEK
jgi:hypothetical protein